MTVTVVGQSTSCFTPDCIQNSRQTLWGGHRNLPSSPGNPLPHTSHPCITQLLSLLTRLMQMACRNLGQLDPRLKQILQKRFIPSHSWQPDPKLHSAPLQDIEAPWKPHLKWGVWLRLEPLSKTASANIWTLTSPLILLWTVCSQSKINLKILSKKLFSSHYKKHVLSEDLGCFTAVLSCTCTSFTTLKWADENGEEGGNMRTS